MNNVCPCCGACSCDHQTQTGVSLLAAAQRVAQPAVSTPFAQIAQAATQQQPVVSPGLPSLAAEKPVRGFMTFPFVVGGDWDQTDRSLSTVASARGRIRVLRVDLLRGPEAWGSTQYHGPIYYAGDAPGTRKKLESGTLPSGIHFEAARGVCLDSVTIDNREMLMDPKEGPLQHYAPSYSSHECITQYTMPPYAITMVNSQIGVTARSKTRDGFRGLWVNLIIDWLPAEPERGKFGGGAEMRGKFGSGSGY
jgi:hypothetical protein